MKHSLVVPAACVGLFVLGCGAPTVEAELPPLASQEAALCAVTAVCEGGETVSCYGNPCSGQDYSGVTCAGVFTPCPETSTCSGLPPCSSLENQLCQPVGARQFCCWDGVEYSIVCSPIDGSATQGRWYFD